MQKQFLKPTSLEVEIKFYEEPVNLTEKDIPDLDNLSQAKMPERKRSGPVSNKEINYSLSLMKDRSKEVPQELVQLLRKKRGADKEINETEKEANANLV